MNIDFEKLKKKKDTRLELIKRLKQIMKKKGWSQGQVAEAMHIARHTVNRWFNQGRLPNKKDKEMIIQILKRYRG